MYEHLHMLAKNALQYSSCIQDTNRKLAATIMYKAYAQIMYSVYTLVYILNALQHGLFEFVCTDCST